MKRQPPDLEVIDGGQSPPHGPFTAADYVQLAALSGRSIVVRIGGVHPGEIVVLGGVPWWARDDIGEGSAAFRRLLLAGGMEAQQPVSCGRLRSRSRPRNVSDSAQSLLLSAAKNLDERRHSLSAPAAEFENPDLNANGLFVDFVDRGVDALLRRDFPAAREAFRAARDIDPNDSTVAANLDRLQALGFGPDGES